MGQDSRVPPVSQAIQSFSDGGRPGKDHEVLPDLGRGCQDAAEVNHGISFNHIAQTRKLSLVGEPRIRHLQAEGDTSLLPLEPRQIQMRDGSLRPPMFPFRRRALYSDDGDGEFPNPLPRRIPDRNVAFERLTRHNRRRGFQGKGKCVGREKLGGDPTLGAGQGEIGQVL